MSSLTFKALIAGVHFDPKKRIVKIQLDATSYVSMDKLITLGPIDESVTITLESAQTCLDDVGDPITFDPEIAKRYEEEAERIMSNEETEEKEGKIITELLTPEASGEEEE